MKKYLAVFDGFKLSKSTLDYAIQITRATDAHLVGVFLDESVYRSYDVYKVIMESGDVTRTMNDLDARDKQKRDESTLYFQQACEKAGIRFNIHRDKKIAEQELKHESIFADLVIISKTETFSLLKEKAPTRFVRNLLTVTQCPVLVVPSRYKPIDKITLLYDGRPSSVYAAKMFSYLLEDLKDLPMEIFTVKDDNTVSMHLPDNKLMREFTKRHYPHATYSVTRGNAEEQINGYFRNQPGNELVVLGAYRRGEISRMFKTSMADILMRDLDQPLFIAHH